MVRGTKLSLRVIQKTETAPVRLKAGRKEKIMSIWAALGFIGMGMVLAHIYNWLAWRKYYEGRNERRNLK